MRITSTVLLAVMLTAPAAGAQTTTAGVSIGAGKTWDDEGGIGNGASLGGRVDTVLFRNTRAEIAVDLLNHDRPGDFFRAHGHTVLVSGSLVQRFGGSRAQPYILGGVTLAHHSGTTTIDGVVTDRKSTDTGFHVGGGLSIRAASRFEFGPEVRFYVVQAGDDSAPAFAQSIGVRAAVRF
jgi:opacity protein-like surface antigen